MLGSDDMIPAGRSDPRLKLNYDDFLLFPDDGKRHELIDGERLRVSGTRRFPAGFFS
jgi:hypothetical protein